MKDGQTRKVTTKEERAGERGFLATHSATLVFASVGAGLDSVIGAQSSAYHACVAAGRADCRVDFDPGAVLTPQLIAALLALGLLALVPVLVRRMAARRLGRACPGDGGDGE